MKEKLARVVLLTIFLPAFLFPLKLVKDKSMAFTQNICSDIIFIEVDSDERTYDRFAEYCCLPADGSGRLLRPMYGQVGRDASVRTQRADERPRRPLRWGSLIFLAFRAEASCAST